ncbi:hypothetical protein O3M35_011462 [Rhynocoris fuscipes]|uniref:Odorant receptor n=1 Tax=Rhynocoris fuscipes TaxID=488301 RepID=A0AAW1D1J4_9HEMI
MTTMKREYSYLLQVGALFLNLRPKWRYLSILQLVIYFTIPIYFMYSAVLTTIAWGDDLNNIATTVHYTTLLLITDIVLVAFIYYRARIADLMRITGNNYYTYKDGFQSSKEEMWKKRDRKLKIILIVAVPLYFSLCVVVGLVIAPNLDANKKSSTNADYINNIYMKSPVPMVFPFEINEEATYFFSTLSQILAGMVIALVIAGADLVLIFLSLGVGFQMNILRDAIQNIDNRALKVFNEIYKEDSKKKTMKELYDDGRFMKLIDWCIKQNVEHHKVISRAFEHISEVGKWPLGAAFFFVSAAIAFALFSFVSSSQIIAQLLSLMLLSAEVWNMLIISLIGQQLTDMSEGIGNDLYDLKWRYWNKSCKVSMLIFKERLKRPLVILAGGLTPINMEMFAAVSQPLRCIINAVFNQKLINPLK